MASVIIAVVGSLLGVVLGFLAQFLQANRAHRWQLEDIKRQAYAEFLRSISASYAQARSRAGDSEDANILRATTVIELIAEDKLAEQTRQLSNDVIEAHNILRDGGSEKDAGVDGVDTARKGLVDLFKADLGIAPSEQLPAAAPAAGPKPG